MNNINFNEINPLKWSEIVAKLAEDENAILAVYKSGAQEKTDYIFTNLKNIQNNRDKLKPLNFLDIQQISQKVVQKLEKEDDKSGIVDNINNCVLKLMNREKNVKNFKPKDAHNRPPPPSKPPPPVPKLPPPSIQAPPPPSNRPPSKPAPPPPIQLDKTVELNESALIDHFSKQPIPSTPSSEEEYDGPVITEQALYNQPAYKKAIKFYNNKRSGGSNVKKMPINELPPQSAKQFLSDKDIYKDILSKSRGFCIGEFHDEISATQYLITNLGSMAKEENLGALFIEGFNDTHHQEILDKFVFPEEYEMDENEQKKNAMELITVLRGFEQQHTHSLKNCPLTLSWELMKCAKQHKVRIIGIDYPCDDLHNWQDATIDEKGLIESVDQVRVALLNYRAMQILDKELPKLPKDKKFICYMGTAHVSEKDSNEKDKPIGIADMLGCPAVIFKGVESPGLKNLRAVYPIDGCLTIDYDPNIIQHRLISSIKSHMKRNIKKKKSNQQKINQT